MHIVLLASAALHLPDTQGTGDQNHDRKQDHQSMT
jgi:hypothetical protein